MITCALQKIKLFFATLVFLMLGFTTIIQAQVPMQPLPAAYHYYDYQYPIYYGYYGYPVRHWAPLGYYHPTPLGYHPNYGVYPNSGNDWQSWQPYRCHKSCTVNSWGHIIRCVNRC